LVLPVGAKSIAMGEVHAALAGDPFNWLANPAALAVRDGSGAGAFHSQWAVDSYYDNIIFNHQFPRALSLGVGVTAMSAPDVDGFDVNGNPTGSLKNNDIQGVVGLTFAPIDWLGVGANFKYFQETIADWTARGFGMDIGALVTLPTPDVRVGLTVRNLGPDVKFAEHDEELPLAMSVGATWTIPLVAQLLNFEIAADLTTPKHEDVYAAFGGELSIRDVVSLRAGYTSDENRVGDGYTAGAGVRLLETLVIDYAWTPYGDLGDFNRIALYYAWGK
jgi:hypothetical protein